MLATVQRLATGRWLMYVHPSILGPALRASTSLVPATGPLGVTAPSSCSHWERKHTAHAPAGRRSPAAGSSRCRRASRCRPRPCPQRNGRSTLPLLAAYGELLPCSASDPHHVTNGYRPQQAWIHHHHRPVVLELWARRTWEVSMEVSMEVSPHEWALQQLICPPSLSPPPPTHTRVTTHPSPPVTTRHAIATYTAGGGAVCPPLVPIKPQPSRPSSASCT